MPKSKARRGNGPARRSRRNSGEAAPPPLPVEDEPSEVKKAFRRAVARFFRAAAASLDAPYPFFLQTNEWKGLCLLMSLMPLEYSAVLLGCGLVSVHRKEDGSVHQVKVADDTVWKTFFRGYGLRTLDGKEGIADITKSGVYADALEMPARRATAPTDRGSMRQFHMLRIGHVGAGETAPNAAREMNQHTDLPETDLRLVTAQRHLHNDVHALLVDMYSEEGSLSDCRAVRDWVVAPPQFRALVARPSPNPRQKKKGRIGSPGKGDKAPPQPADTASGPAITATSPDATPGQGTTTDALNLLLSPPAIQKTSVEEALLLSPEGKQFLIEQFPTLATMTPESLGSWDDTKRQEFDDELRRLRERFEKPGVPEDVRALCPTLAMLSPEVVLRGGDMVGELDMGQLKMEASLRDYWKWHESKGTPITFRHDNGVPGRLLPLNMKKTEEGYVPDLAKCLKSLLGVVEEGTTEDNAEQVVDSMLGYLLTKQRDHTIRKLRQRRLIPEVMDEFDVAATIDESNIKIWQWRKVVQCLKLFMDVEKVCVPDNKLQLLGVNHGEIKHGTYNYADPKKPGQVKEKIRYWTKDPVYEYVASVMSLINGYDLDLDEIDFIHVAHGGDHGKEKFRFASKVVIRMKDGRYYDDIFGLADVKCKKDKAAVLENTVMKELTTGINAIESGELVFEKVDGGDAWSVELREKKEEEIPSNNGNETVKQHLCFLVGDLAFLAVMLGKEGFETYWCCWCSLNRTQWQTEDHIAGVELTWEVLEAQAKKNEAEKLSGVQMMGVKRVPHFNIPFDRTIFSVLHALIGIGNQIMAYLEHFVDQKLEKISPKERATRAAVPLNESMWREAVEKLKQWEESDEGGALQKTLERRVKALQLEITILNSAATPNADQLQTKAHELDLSEVEIETLKAARVKLGKERDDFRARAQEAKKDLKKFTSTRKKSDKSIYNKMDEIYQSFRVDRAAYHEKQFNGVNMRKLMEESFALFGKNGEGGSIRALLHGENTTPGLTAKINEVCDNVGLALNLWDTAFSAVHKVDPSKEKDGDCDKAQDAIDLAVAQLRRMGLSITPKAHGMEKHCVAQMRAIPGGIAKLIEHWVERYHQDGFRYDLAYCRAGSLEKQAKIRSTLEARARNPKVRMKKAKLHKRYKGRRQRRKKALVKEEKELQVKTERRDGASLEMMALLQEAKVLAAFEAKLKEEAERGRGKRTKIPTKRYED